MGFLKLLLDLPFIKPLGEWLKNLFLGFLLVKAGEQKQQLKDLKEEEKNVQEAKRISHRVDSMSDDELRSLLMAGQPRKDTKD